MMKKIRSYSAIIVCAALVLAACQNPFSADTGTWKSKSKKGLRIDLGGIAAKTLLPAPDFDSFTIQFLPLEGQKSRNNEVLDNGETSVLVTDLTDGEWNIYVIGYYQGNPLAQGIGYIVIDSSVFQNITIELEAVEPFGSYPGTFKYTVLFPEYLISYAKIHIKQLISGIDVFTDVFDTSASGAEELPPGYYFVSVVFYPLLGKPETKSEVAYIYSNMPTSGAFVYEGGCMDCGEYPCVCGGIAMVWVNSGTYTRGSNDYQDANASPPHQVTLTNGFWMGIYEVTQEQYESVMGINPSAFTAINGYHPAEGEIGSKRPVEQVSWYDTVEFCNKLSIREGFAPVYTITNRVPESGYPITSAMVTAKANADGYRLPTEAEWEYACRAGTSTAWAFGDAESKLANYAWYNVNADLTHEAGQKQPNAWGFYDMHGNVWEYCWDRYEDYSGDAKTDPAVAMGSHYIIRGGSYWNGAENLRSAFRHGYYSEACNSDRGFRVVRSPYITPAVYNVAVSAADNAETAAKGGPLQLFADVETSGRAAHSVTWAITSSGHDAGTSIGEDGLLTIGADETQTSITVRATATEPGFTGVYGEITIAICIEVTVAMWDREGNGWYGATNLRVNVNGNDIERVRLNSDYGPEYFRFTVHNGDAVKFYWVSLDYNECAYSVYFSHDPPNPPFDPYPANWSLADDPNGRVMVFRQFKDDNILFGNGALIGSFTVTSAVITIDAHPAAETYVVAGSISESLGVSARVTKGAQPDYQWYRNTENSNVGGTAIDGATAVSYAIPETLTDRISYYFCELNADGAAPVRSNAATVIAEPSVFPVETEWVSGGNFELGKNLGNGGGSDETPVSPVHLTGFYIGKYEVTQGQYEAIMGINPSYFHGGSGRVPAEGEFQRRRPVEQVSWFDAIEFCNKLSVKEGFTPVYTIDNRNPATGYPIESANVTANFGADGYRLPTEAQWEYAAKGGNGSPGSYTFAGSNSAATVAWFNGNSSVTHEAGLKEPNGLGLYDMSGNVWEWCGDWHGGYTSNAKTDPIGASSGSSRVIRGGAYNQSATNTRSVYRSYTYPSSPNERIGFRVSLPSGSPIITIIEQPEAAVSLTAGSISEALSLTASVTQDAQINYQWYSNATHSNVGGTAIDGATETSFAIPVSLDAGWYYYFVEVSAVGAAPVRSAVTTLTVEPAVFPMQMVSVTGGSFELGKNLGSGGGSDVTPVSTVYLTGFSIGKYEVTQAQYEAIMGVNPSYFHGGSGRAPETGEYQSVRPVEYITWFDAIEFCNKLSEKEELTPVYTIIGRTPGTGYPITSATINANWNANGYRLPTEAQWEYAAKGGNTGESFTYAGSNDIGSVAWYSNNSTSRTHGAGLRSPNGLGIYDMSGNVYEWCWDWYGEYTGEVKTDPMGSNSGSYRIFRGGAYNESATNTRSAYRTYNNQYTRNQYTGFRVALPSDDPVISVTALPAAETVVTAGSISESLSLTASVTLGAQINYQWYRNTTKTNAGGTAVANEGTSASFAIPAALTPGTYYYFAELSAAGAALVRTRPSVVRVDPPPFPMEMASVPVGSFELGKNLGTGGGSDVSPVSPVHISGFTIGKYEVTQKQYEAVTGFNPSYFHGGSGREPASGEHQSQRPVENVSWFDAIEFCNKLSVMEGLTPVYMLIGRSPGTGYPITSFTSINVIQDADGYRLPTEAQWEYAAKGGNGSPGNYTFAGSSNPDTVAWYTSNSSGRTHAVGLKTANGLGIHDMSGNVQEWCWDGYDSYTSHTKTDPAGIASSSRVIRGGYYNSSFEDVRSVYRNYNTYSYNYQYRGFRVARRSDNPVISIEIQPTPEVTVYEQEISGNLHITASVTKGATLTYQWYRNTINSNVGGTTVSSGGSGANYTIPTTLTAGTYYYFVELRAEGAAILRSTVVTLTVEPPPFPNSTMDTVPVPGGSFELGMNLGSGGGSSLSPVSTVRMTGFKMGKYEVTQGQYLKVMGANPSYFHGGSGREPASGEFQSKRPVEQVSWFDAVEFCNKLSVIEGLTPAYTITNRSPASGYPITGATVTVDWNANGYRLPTEAQWEYAAKGGNGSPGSFTYAGSNSPDTVAWYTSNSSGRTHAAGLKTANGLGIHDMSGNVNEWCWDLYGDYTANVKTDPTGGTAGTNRIIRGGYYNNSYENVLSVYRNYGSQGSGYNSQRGFRVMLPSDDPVITIETQPPATTGVLAGNISGSLAVTASVTKDATLSYQWYNNTSATNSGGTVISGATSASYAIPTTLAAGTYYYFCEVSATGGAAPVRTNAVTVTVAASYTVSYNINNGTGTTPNAQTVNTGSSVTLASSSGFSRSGFTFGGWNTNAAGTGTNYTAESSYTPNGNITLYAKWIEIEMIWVPGGSFELGKDLGTAAIGDVTPVSTVTLTGFYMGKYEVTQEQYLAVTGSNPSIFSSSPATGETQARRPVETVSWYDAIVFCNTLSMMEGLTPAYRINGSTDPAIWGTVPTSSNGTWNAAEVVAGSTGYRLPTEAQWEYAAKGGNGSPGSYTYSGSNDPGAVAWYSANSGNITHEVGKKLPNGLGLYDMSGNVWEWCWDWYGSYTSGAKTDPTGVSSGSFRDFRGGDWGNSAGGVRSVDRNNHFPSYRSNSLGFRLVRPDTVAASYTVSYNINSGTGTTPDAQTVNAGSSVTLASGSGLSRSGYLFGGWNTNAAGTGTNYAAGFDYTPSGNITLYVRWVEPNIVSPNNFQMVWVPSGSFELGKDLGTAATGDATPVSTVTLTGFYMGKYQVTQEQYQAVTGSNPSYFSTSPAAGETQSKRPVEQVSWYEAIVFCNKLSMMEGLTPAYRINGSTDPAIWGTVPTSSNGTWNAAEVVAGSTGYRLPTEAQWEYAAKGGNGSPGSYTYSGSNDPGAVAWYDANSGSMTHEVGKKLPNGLGLYDMSGNVWEWCWDWYGSYTSGAKVDPTGASSGSDRVFRGGGWFLSAVSVRSVYRYFSYPYGRNSGIGFRLSRP